VPGLGPFDCALYTGVLAFIGSDYRTPSVMSTAAAAGSGSPTAASKTARYHRSPGDDISTLKSKLKSAEDSNVINDMALTRTLEELSKYQDQNRELQTERDALTRERQTLSTKLSIVEGELADLRKDRKDLDAQVETGRQYTTHLSARLSHVTAENTM
jgi:chromosome segregation ATPase